MALTREQFQKALSSGFTTDQIIQFEKQRVNRPTTKEGLVGYVEKAGQEAEKKMPLLKSLAGVGPSELQKVAERRMRATGETGRIMKEAKTPAEMAEATLLPAAVPSLAGLTMGKVLRPEESVVPLMGAALQAGAEDVFSIPAAYFNQYLLNYPRSALKKLGFEYPKARTAVGKAAYYAAGAKGLLETPTLAGKLGRGKALLPQMARGALTGAMYAPEDLTDVNSRAWQAIFGAFMPAGIRAAGTILRIPAKALRGLAQIPSKSVKWMKMRGADKIFTPMKERVDYVKSVLAPKVFNIYEQKTTQVLDRAGKMFNTSLANIKKPTIKLGSTFNKTRNILKNYDLIDERGFLKTNIKEKEIPQSIKIIADMYSKMSEGSITRTGKVPVKISPRVNKGFFQFYRQMLRSTQKSAGSFKQDVQSVIEGLYDDASKAGAKGIKEAKALYRQAMQFEDKFYYDLKKMGNELQTAVNPKNWQSVRERMRPIFGEMTDEIFNSIKDHRVMQELLTQGKAPLGKLGVISRLTKAGLRGYYENVLPVVQKTKELGKKLLPTQAR